MAEKPRWLGVQALAQRYGVSPHTVYSWVEQGIIPHGRAGRVLTFDVEACDEWVRQRGNAGGLAFSVCGGSDERLRAIEKALSEHRFTQTRCDQFLLRRIEKLERQLQERESG